MTTLLLIVWGLLIALAVFVFAIRPQRSHHSLFELKRREDTETIRREALLDNVQALLRFVGVTLLVLAGIVSFELWDWWGLVIAIASIIFVMVASKSKSLRRTGTRVYASRETKILGFVESAPIIFKLMGGERHTPHDQKLESLDHLLHLVDSAGHILTPEQQKVIRHSVKWHSTQIGEIMTHRPSIVPIKHKELLGPLVLDDLHRSGFSRFPVIDGNIDNVVGILNISDLLEIDTNRKSQIVEKIMTPQVLRIKAEDTLPSALKILQKSHQNVIIVVDDEGHTQGMVTLTDITGALVGK